LKRFVEQNQGITLLPELATLHLSAAKKQMLRYFKDPAPAREISMVTLKSFVKRKLIELLQAEIERCLPASILKKKDQKRIDVL
jgi:LysR family hydrogen peroxide-inducible transcriptional activator